MQPINNKEGIPFEHYCAQWRELDPAEAGARCAAAFDGSEFRLRLFGVDYFLRWPDFAIRADRQDSFALSNIPAQILLMRYLMVGKASAPRGQFLTYREMPWGAVYLTPFTGRCLTRAAFTFGTRISAFKQAMLAQNAAPLSHGDASFELQALEDFSLRLIVWEGDDEFPPNGQILFSDNCADVFSAEDLAVLCDILISNTKSLMV